MRVVQAERDRAIQGDLVLPVRPAQIAPAGHAVGCRSLAVVVPPGYPPEKGPLQPVYQNLGDLPPPTFRYFPRRA